MKSKLKDTGISFLYILIPIGVLCLLAIILTPIIGFLTISNYISLPYDEISFKSLIEYIGYYFSQSVYWILAISFIISLPIYLLIFKKNEKNFFKTIKLNKANIKFIIVSSIIGISLNFALLGITNILNIDYYNTVVNILSNADSRILYIVVLLIIEPFFSEILFRGVILRQLTNSYSLIMSIIIQNLLFVLYYCSTDFLKITVAFIVGIISATICLYGDSLLNSILFHILFKLSSLVIYIVIIYMNLNITHYLIISIIASLIIILSLIHLKKIHNCQ